MTGPDRPGVLLAVSAAFASAGVVPHTARIYTSDKQVNDRFAISDRVGRKLDASAMNAIRLALTEGRTAHRKTADVETNATDTERQRGGDLREIARQYHPVTPIQIAMSRTDAAFESETVRRDAPGDSCLR
ncbi:MAG: hypothetical protein LH616_19520 [Ilumatobacteraceae bacterium]|nr:hypothetical protein [Ilumatobacteraceae bacterium]